MKTILSEITNINLYKKNYFFFKNKFLLTSIKLMLIIKLKKFRLNLIKRFFFTIELVSGLKPIIKKIYFKKISKKKMQLRLIILKNIHVSYIFEFMNYFFYIIQFLTTTTNRYYLNKARLKKDYLINSNAFYVFNLSNIFNLFTLNAKQFRYIFLKNYKLNLSFYFLNKFSNIRLSIFDEFFLAIKKFKKSWISKFDEEA